MEEEIKISERALAACTDEYREQSDIWKTLENKAQVAITVAGVFLAAVFTFSRDANLNYEIKGCLGVTLLALLSALLCALWVLQVEEFDMPVSGIEVLKLAQELLDPVRAEEPEGDRFKKIVGSLTEGYDDVLGKIGAINEHKQKRLGYTYCLLRVAAVAATCGAVIELITLR
jgi:hypothetical protein